MHDSSAVHPLRSSSPARGAHWSGQFNPTTAADAHLVHSNRNGNTWQVAALNRSGSSRSLTVTAICVGG